MTTPAPLTRFSWEQAVAGPDGPPSSTTRLVLLVIGMHVRRKGSLQCWPSIRTLETATCLSQRSIIDQIEAAAAMGWITKSTGQTGGMRRRGSIYELRMPTAERGSAVAGRPSAERGSAVHGRRPLNVTQSTAERDSSQPLNVVPPLLTSEVRRKEEGGEVAGRKPSSIPDEKPEAKGHGTSATASPHHGSNGQGAQQEKGNGASAWAERNMPRHEGESLEEYRKRAVRGFLRAMAGKARQAVAR